MTKVFIEKENRVRIFEGEYEYTECGIGTDGKPAMHIAMGIKAAGGMELSVYFNDMEEFKEFFK